MENKILNKNQILGTIIGGILSSIIFGGITYINVNYANYQIKPDRLTSIIMALIVGFPIGMILGYSVVSIISKKNIKTKK